MRLAATLAVDEGPVAARRLFAQQLHVEHDVTLPEVHEINLAPIKKQWIADGRNYATFNGADQKTITKVTARYLRVEDAHIPSPVVEVPDSRSLARARAPRSLAHRVSRSGGTDPLSFKTGLGSDSRPRGGWELGFQVASFPVVPPAHSRASS